MGYEAWRPPAAPGSSDKATAPRDPASQCLRPRGANACPSKVATSRSHAEGR